MKFLTSTEKKTRMQGIRKEIFREVWIQSLLTELEKK
jgi:hypothetical protein